MVHYMTKGMEDTRRRKKPQHIMERRGPEVNEWIKSTLPPMQMRNDTASYTTFKPPEQIRKEVIHNHIAQQARALVGHLGYTEQPKLPRSDGAKPPEQHTAWFDGKLPIYSSQTVGMSMGIGGQPIVWDLAAHHGHGEGVGNVPSRNFSCTGFR